MDRWALPTFICDRRLVRDGVPRVAAVGLWFARLCNSDWPDALPRLTPRWWTVSKKSFCPEDDTRCVFVSPVALQCVCVTEPDNQHSE